MCLCIVWCMHVRKTNKKKQLTTENKRNIIRNITSAWDTTKTQTYINTHTKCSNTCLNHRHLVNRVVYSTVYRVHTIQPVNSKTFTKSSFFFVFFDSFTNTHNLTQRATHRYTVHIRNELKWKKKHKTFSYYTAWIKVLHNLLLWFSISFHPSCLSLFAVPLFYISTCVRLQVFGLLYINCIFFSLYTCILLLFLLPFRCRHFFPTKLNKCFFLFYNSARNKNTNICSNGISCVSYTV